MKTHLIAVTPEEVLSADVLVWVFRLVLERGAVRDVLPMLVPKTPGVDAGDDCGGDHHAVHSVSCATRIDRRPRHRLFEGRARRSAWEAY